MDDDGRLVSDPYDARQLSLRQGHALRIETGDPLWVTRRPVTDLARVYVEPTNACNLACATCVRNVWSAQSGFMSEETFDAVLRGLASFPRPPVVFFGGFGEPLAHPRILSMIEGAQRLGSRVEMITNGILLDDEVRRAIVSLGLHRLWVSIDGATPAAYRDVRIGDALPEILGNLAALRRLREASPGLGPRLGLVFVAMRRNVAQLPEVVKLGREAGMDQLLVTNVLAYTDDLRNEVLYDEGLAPGDGDSPERPAILAAASPLSAATTPSPAATRLEGPLTVDGRLDEAAWGNAATASGFRQWSPNRGEPARLETRVRVLFDDEHLYVGASLENPGGPPAVAARVHRRDRDSYSDWFGVSIDVEGRGRNARMFRVNAANAQRDLLQFEEAADDDTWDAVWDSAMSIGAAGWSLEMRIPLEVLRPNASPAPQRWRIYFYRENQLPYEVTGWMVVPRGAQGFVSHFYPLEEVVVAKPPRRRDLTAHTSVRSKVRTIEPYDDLGGTFRAGADASLGIGTTGQLDVSLLPDFGHVEVDRQVLNLSTTETFFPEKRPFFTEGADAFTLPGLQLFSSRRIGHALAPPAVPEGTAGVDGSYRSTSRRTKLTGIVAGSIAGPGGNGERGWGADLELVHTFRVPWTATLHLTDLSPRFDPNDLGYLARPDVRQGWVDVRRQWDRTAGAFRNWEVAFGGIVRRDHAGHTLTRQVEATLGTQFTNLWRVSAIAGAYLAADDDQELRTFGQERKLILRRPDRPFAVVSFGTAPQSAWSVSGEARWTSWEGGPTNELTVAQVVRPTSRLDVELETSYQRASGERRWLETPTPGAPVAGLRALRQLDQSIRISFTVSTRATVQLFSQWRAARWSFRETRAWSGAGGGVAAAAAGPTTFSDRTWNLNLIG